MSESKKPRPLNIDAIEESVRQNRAAQAARESDMRRQQREKVQGTITKAVGTGDARTARGRLRLMIERLRQEPSDKQRLNTFADGRVVQYGDVRRLGAQREKVPIVTRTDIHVSAEDPGKKIVIEYTEHPSETSPTMAQIPDIKRITVLGGQSGGRAALEVRTDMARPDFPVYTFYDRENRPIGKAEGQTVDLMLAQHFTGVEIPGSIGFEIKPTTIEPNVLSYLGNLIPPDRPLPPPPIAGTK